MGVIDQRYELESQKSRIEQVGRAGRDPEVVLLSIQDVLFARLSYIHRKFFSRSEIIISQSIANSYLSDYVLIW